MCVLFVFVDTKPKVNGYRVIIASNRDEFFHRPADFARFFPNDNVIAGRDMEKGREGGTWLGVSLAKTEKFKFRLGALLNVTGEERKKNAQGRGFIVMNYLKQNRSNVGDYVNDILINENNNYNAFHFVGLEMNDDCSKILHASNSPTFDVQSFEGSQILSFGNSPLDSPLEKVKKGKERFVEIIKKFNNVTDKNELKNDLLQLLKWEDKHLPDPELKKRAPETYEGLSSIFVQIENSYGTRTHSIILVSEDWKVDFIEETMEEPCDPVNPIWHKQTIRSSL